MILPRVVKIPPGPPPGVLILSASVPSFAVIGTPPAAIIGEEVNRILCILLQSPGPTMLPEMVLSAFRLARESPFVPSPQSRCALPHLTKATERAWHSRADCQEGPYLFQGA